MKILLDYHREARDEGDSVLAVGQQLEAAAEEAGEVVRVPINARRWDRESLVSWLVEEVQGCDIAVLANTPLIHALRDTAPLCRVIFHVLGDLTHGASSLRHVVSRLRGGDLIWCSSYADQEMVENVLLAGTYRCSVLPYSVDTKLFRPVGKHLRHAIRERLGLADEDFVMYYPGRIAIEKNVVPLLNVLEVIKADYPNAKLLLPSRVTLEPVPEYHRYRADVGDIVDDLVERPELASHVRRVPWLGGAGLAAVFGACDVVVSFSVALGENFGMSLAESLACGVPVVATAWGGYKDIASDEVGGAVETWLSNTGIRFDQVGAIERLRTLIDDRSLLTQCGMAARERAVERYSRRIFYENFGSMLRTLQASPVTSQSPRLARLGEVLQDEFVRVSLSGERVPIRAQFHGPGDPAFQDLIRPYTSRRAEKDADLNQESLKVSLAVAGRIAGGYFVSDDPLWPFRRALSSSEEGILVRLLGRPCHSTGVAAGEREAVVALYETGIVGVNLR